MGLAASRQEAFWEACGFGNLERARHFLQEGDIDVNWVSYTNDCCPIHVASQGKPKIVQLLLEHNCDVNVRDNRGNLPLHHAAMKGHSDIVQTLIDAGCEVNAQEKNGWTALHNAAYWCHPEVVRVLLKNGCDVHIQNKDERTALHECARSQNKDEKKLGEIAEVLIDAGSDINSKSSDWGEADLTGLMYASFHNHPDVASALIKAGCELNAVGTTFWTALHWAADRGNDELVYILLDAGIDPTIRDMRGETAVDRAQSDDIRDFIATAVDIHKELNKVKQPVIRPAVQLRTPEEPFKPKCDASFKSQSFLPKDWKPANPVNVKNLINEKKSRLAAMTSQKYRTELANRTGTGVIKDEDVTKSCENEKYKDVKKSSESETEGIRKSCENEEDEEEKKINENEEAVSLNKEIDDKFTSNCDTDSIANPDKELCGIAESEENSNTGKVEGNLSDDDCCPNGESADKRSKTDDRLSESDEESVESSKCKVEKDPKVKTEDNGNKHLESFDSSVEPTSAKSSQLDEQTHEVTNEVKKDTDSQTQFKDYNFVSVTCTNEKGDAFMIEDKTGVSSVDSREVDSNSKGLEKIGEEERT